ncbi:MAG: hypothetical protein K6D98_04105 [Clostridiales bacterium]|nr:hypothetical protein [Clostridiales bacterium]
MISKQPDQTAYLLNKLVQEGAGGTGGGNIKLYSTTGQHTDGAMTQKATTNALGTKADTITVGNQLAGKVDKETGKGLSSNDFTDEDLTKLNGIEAGAQVNVQSDWSQTNTSADDYIKNKPTIPGPYTLPPATASTLGGIKVGSNLSVTSDGTLSADGGALPSNLVYHDDPSTVVPTVPYVNTGDIVNGAVTSDKIDLSTLVTDWVTVASGTSWSIEYQKFGPIVFVRGHSQGVVNIPANSTYNSIATLPVGCRPSKQVLGFVSLQGGTQSASRYYRIAPEGIVSIYNRDNGVDTNFSYWEFYSVFLAN